MLFQILVLIDEEEERRVIGTGREGGALLVPGTYMMKKYEKHQMHKGDRSDNGLHRSVTL